jgi:hypothetical protein
MVGSRVTYRLLLQGHTRENFITAGLGKHFNLILRTTQFNFHKFHMVPTLLLCVLYGSQNKQQLLPYKTLRDWFL